MNDLCIFEHYMYTCLCVHMTVVIPSAFLFGSECNMKCAFSRNYNLFFYFFIVHFYLYQDNKNLFIC
jgi:hypothetical protein